MNYREIFLKIWRDQVWSKVISFGICALIASIYSYIVPDELSSILGIPNIIIIVLVFIVSFLTIYFIRKVYRIRSGKTLVYVSTGGTCRDPMAKAITIKLLEKYKLRHPLHIIAAGRGPLSKTEASFGARYAIKEIYHEDLLADHKPELLTPELVNKADLILLMNRYQKKGLPQEKTFGFKEFFGLEGDIDDPWDERQPDGQDMQTFSRYKKCADEIKTILETNIEHLIKVLNL